VDAPPADARDRIAAIFKKAQAGAKPKAAPAPRSGDDAGDRIAAIMRKELQPRRADPDQRSAKTGTSDAGAMSQDLAALGYGDINAFSFEGGTTAQAQSPAKVAVKVVDLLRAELGGERNANHAILLTAVGGLAGYAAQRAVWEGKVLPGIISITDAFRVVKTAKGETFFFSAETDKFLASLDPRYLSIWKIVTGTTRVSGEHPDVTDLFRHTESSIGTSDFGVPRVPGNCHSTVSPRDAVNGLWPQIRQLLAQAEPDLWPVHMAVAARGLITAAQRIIPPALGAKIVMEAAVPMSRIDPAKVPRK
jgi:hypothetical protein